MITNTDINNSCLAIEKLAKAMNLKESEIIEIINDGLELKYSRRIPFDIEDLMDELENDYTDF